ncbi:MAG TPA: hypothetical protein VNZ22_16265, partial [Bacillota bacterium]|nr:hypothetical protein [Bacillota bacterium]
MKPSPQPPASLPRAERLPQLFAGLFGAFLGLSLLKFGNPPIMEKWVSTPTNIYEFLLGYPWPIAWAYALLGLVTILGLRMVRWKIQVPRWLLILPLVWLGWQFVAATQTLDPNLSWLTLK